MKDNFSIREDDGQVPCQRNEDQHPGAAQGPQINLYSLHIPIASSTPLCPAGRHQTAHHMIGIWNHTHLHAHASLSVKEEVLYEESTT